MTPDAPEELDEVLVTGVQPGPAMWRVRRGEHSLWIVGSLSPLPAKMTWRSRQVEQVIEQSGEILGQYDFRADLKGGLFVALRLLPAVVRLRKNPDGATLRAVTPPDVYARYSTTYRRFHGKDPDPKDRLRPFAAADQLFDKALERTGLSTRAVVWPLVEKQAKQHKVRLREREFVIPLDEPKALIEELERVPRDREVACLVATLDRIDQDLPNMRRRAEAWAIGDVPTLQALPWVDEGKTCLDALMVQPKLRALIEEQQARVEADWPGIVEYMLLAHETSLTVVSIQQLWGEKGVLARLRASGYIVEEPVFRP
jgi:uncharacterized protein YbaP (TraB family)